MRPAASSATSSGTGEIDMLDCRHGGDSPLGTTAGTAPSAGPAVVPVDFVAQSLGKPILKSPVGAAQLHEFGCHHPRAEGL